MRQVSARCIARRRIGIECEALAVVHRRRAAGEGAEPKFRPLQIDQDADGPAGSSSTARIMG